MVRRLALSSHKSPYDFPRQLPCLNRLFMCLLVVGSNFVVLNHKIVGSLQLVCFAFILMQFVKRVIQYGLSGLLAVLVLLHLLPLLSTQEYKPSPSNCPTSFKCAYLGPVHYPFSNSSRSDCGLCVIDCDAQPSPKINLGSVAQRVEVKSLLPGNFIKLHDPLLQSYLVNSSCDIFNYSLSSFNSPFISFTVVSSITLFKCINDSQNMPEVLEYFRDYNKSETCNDFALFYRHPSYGSPDRTPPNGCEVVNLPMVSWGEASKDTELFQLLTAEFELEWHLSEDCQQCYSRGDLCYPGYPGNCSPAEPLKRRQPRKTNLKVMLATGFSASGTIVAIILYLYFIRKRFPGKSITFWKKTEDCENIEAFLKMFGSLGPRRYSYSHVKKITNSFKDKLGQGGYGCVYKGMLHDGSLVAVKVLHESKGTGEEFVNEVASISRTSHVNIVSLLGFCFEGSKRALIFEFMPNGSLEKFIYNENSTAEGEGQLGWENLFQIAVGIARGLEYLHRGCNTRILHFDIKPHNILLDKDFHPKISDFGLAKLCPGRASQVSLLGARGTIGYIAPEVFSRNFGEVSHKSDVYSYGMMVMEMVGGRKNADAVVDLSSAGFYFPHWICQRLELEEEIGLQGIRNEEEYERARKMIIVGLWCIQTSPVTRPSMSRVVEMLEGSVENLQIPPKPILSLPPILATNSITTFCSHSELLELL